MADYDSSNMITFKRVCLLLVDIIINDIVGKIN